MRHKDRDPLQKEPSRDLFRRGISRLRRLILPSSQGLQIGDNFVTAKDDGAGNTDPFWQRADGTESNLIDDVAAHDYDTHSGGVPFAELEYDDATSDPLIDADSASDGTETSAARKDHVHPKHHAKYTNAEAISAVEGEATLDLTGDVTIDGAKSLSVDVINEKDSAAGVTIDGVQMKDSFVVVTSGAGMNSIGSIDLKIDSDNNSTAEKLRILKDAGVEIAVFHEDGSLDIDVINEETAAAGVTIDSVLLKDGVVTVGDVAFDDATSDPLPVDSTSAADGSENSIARKDHRHFATAATSSVQGIAELATAAETSTGTDTARVVPVVALPIQVQDSKYVYAADAEASDTYVITLTPAIAAYATGQVFHFKANTVNTGAATLNVNGKGAKAILKEHDVALSNGDIEAGQIVTVIYDGTQFQMQSLLGNAPGGGGGGYDTVEEEGSALTQRTTMDFKGGLVTAVDDGAETEIRIGKQPDDTDLFSTSDSNPHLTIGKSSGGVRLNDFAAVRGDPATTDGSALFRVVATTTATTAGIKIEPTMTGSDINRTVIGITGGAANQVTGTASQCTGLSYQYVLQATGANTKGTGMQLKGAVVLQANTVDEFTGMRVETITASTNSGTITNTWGVRIKDQKATGMTQTTISALHIENQTAGTNVYPLRIDGNSDNQDHYSVHQPSIVLFKAITAGDDFMGLTTAAKAGDGVLGWGDAATAPDEVTNPTGGLILWAAAGALFGIGSSGTKTTIAAAEPHCPTCRKDAVLEWSNKGQRWHLQVCMWCYGTNGGAGVIKQESNARA